MLAILRRAAAPGCRRFWGHPSARANHGLPEVRARYDFKTVIDDIEAIERNIENRNMSVRARDVAEAYDGWRTLVQRVNALRHERNQLSKSFKSLGSQEERDALSRKVKDLKAELGEVEGRASEAEARLHQKALLIPNSTHPDVPVGPEDCANVVSVRGPKPQFAFPPRDHVTLAEALDIVDFESGSRVSGSKFAYLTNEGALLEFALAQWAMSRAAARGFKLVITPDIAHERMVEACGFQPRSEASQVYTLAGTDMCLVGTSEIALAGMQAGKVLMEEELPMRVAAFSHCFRQEAGSSGAETRGLYRLHQFSKVELFTFVAPEDSDRALEDLRRVQEDMFEELGLHFRVLDMPTEELGASAYRKYDVEAWMPGRGAFGEISSASNCTDYQARRLNARYLPGAEGVSEGATPATYRFLHTLNGTACAIPRTILALLETHQQEDGSVLLPEALQPFMGGIKQISPRKPLPSL